MITFEKEEGGFGSSKVRSFQISTHLTSSGPWEGIHFQPLCLYFDRSKFKASFGPFWSCFFGV